MPPPDADFAFEIDFAKGEGNPKRIFEAAILLIGAFETLDGALATSIASEIKPLLVVEDVETGSIKVWLKNILKSVEDDALRDLDWRPLVGKYLVRAKYIVLEFLDDDKARGPRAIPNLREALRRLAAETDVRQLPDYAPVHEGRLVTAMDRIQDAKRVLDRRDRLTIETEDQTYEVDLDKTWQPSAEIEVDRESTETTSEGEVVLTVRKPDMIKDSMWQFTHGKLNVAAPIKDDPWLDAFHARKIPILPGDALKCRV
ncbi:MAG TPA: hypothetical protein VHD15_10225, partial [Hyphomicrobiales bacterium]|nr:hypothetical protein [Hyphomicrobiales bacterium]